MQESWQILRKNDRRLALCLLFALKADRQILVDIFSLAIELENAIRIPSDIILATIRLQWWQDALANDVVAEVPLIRAMQAHISAARISRDRLLALVGLWQSRINDENVNADDCHAGCWQLAVELTCGANFTGPARAIAKHYYPGDIRLPPIKASDLTHLRYGGRRARWLYLAGCLTKRKLATVDEDPLLIWRLLFWRFGIGGG